MQSTEINTTPELIHAVASVARIDQARKDGNISEMFANCQTFCDIMEDIYDREDYELLAHLDDVITEI